MGTHRIPAGYHGKKKKFKPTWGILEERKENKHFISCKEKAFCFPKCLTRSTCCKHSSNFELHYDFFQRFYM